MYYNSLNINIIFNYITYTYTHTYIYIYIYNIRYVKYIHTLLIFAYIFPNIY